MRDKEIVGLWESYLEVCETQQLDELSDKTVSSALNARIAATGDASDRAYKHRNPESMRAAEKASDKEVSMRRAVAKRRKRKLGEETDLFDTILEYLVAEGYADTNEAALAIMANMSEEWKQSIVEGFQPVSDNAAEAMRRREASLRPGAYPGDVGNNWKKSIKMRDAMSKTGVKPI